MWDQCSLIHVFLCVCYTVGDSYFRLLSTKEGRKWIEVSLRKKDVFFYLFMFYLQEIYDVSWKNCLKCIDYFYFPRTLSKGFLKYLKYFHAFV